MPNVFFIGEIRHAKVDADLMSITFSVIPGNSNWLLKAGYASGETMTSAVGPVDGVGVVNHPIDLHYEASTSEGWPCLVVEVLTAFARLKKSFKIVLFYCIYLKFVI